MSTTPSTQPTYLDCDTGVDDALAIAYLLAGPQVELLGIGTVSGNTDAVRAARNTLDVLALAGRPDLPVAVGETTARNGVLHTGSARVHGGNGIGGVELPHSDAEPVEPDAADLLIELARTHPGELDVLATGPLTNLALALDREPQLPQLVRRVVAMGGAALAPGNVTAVAEANIWHDAEAAQAVVAAPWDVTLVPLDVTLEHRLDEEQAALLAATGHPLLTALAAMLAGYLDFYVGVFGHRSCALHDPLAAAILTGEATPTLAPEVPVVVDCTDGPGRGQTVADLRRRHLAFAGQTGANARVVLEVAEPFGPQLVDRLLRYAGG